MEITITQTFEVKTKDIKDLMVCALEGGINYWCGSAEVKVQPIEDWEFASDVLGLTGGVLELTDAENEDEKWELTQEKLLKGIEKEIIHGGFNSFQDLMENHDAETADSIIQFALFNEIVYG